MKILRTYEEYKYLKIDNKKNNKKDPNEPFFNIDKKEYKKNKKAL